MRISLIIPFLLLLGACSGRREDMGTTPRIRPIEIAGKTADVLFRVSRIIDLETLPGSLISFPFDLHVSGGEIFVASRNNEIKVFNMDGKYLRNIGCLGDGPGEYRSINSLFPHGNDEIGVYDWSNLRLTLFSRKGGYRMSAVLGMPGMEGVRSVLFIDGSYYIHVPSSPAENHHLIRLDSTMAVSKTYIESDPRYFGYQDRQLFNGGIVADRERGCMYEADSYFYGIRRITLSTGAVNTVEFEPPSFYVPMPVLDAPSSMEETRTLFQKGTNVYNIFMAAGCYLILEYHQAFDRGRVKIVYLLYDLASGKCITIPGGQVHPTYSDGQNLYALIYPDTKGKSSGEMVGNPSLVVYNLSVDGI
jgi:hypothetical protein